MTANDLAQAVFGLLELVQLAAGLYERETQARVIWKMIDCGAQQRVGALCIRAALAIVQQKVREGLGDLWIVVTQLVPARDGILGHSDAESLGEQWHRVPGDRQMSGTTQQNRSNPLPNFPALRSLKAGGAFPNPLVAIRTRRIAIDGIEPGGDRLCPLTTSLAPSRMNPDGRGIFRSGAIAFRKQGSHSCPESRLPPIVCLFIVFNRAEGEFPPCPAILWVAFHPPQQHGINLPLRFSSAIQLPVMQLLEFVMTGIFFHPARCQFQRSSGAVALGNQIHQRVAGWHVTSQLADPSLGVLDGSSQVVAQAVNLPRRFTKPRQVAGF